MKISKSILAVAFLASITSFAQASETSPSNNFFGGVSVGSFGISGSDESSSTAYGVTGGYRHYITDEFSADATVSYIGTNSDSSDKFIIPTVGIAYDYRLSNGVVIRPKAGIGYHFDKYDGGSDSNPAYRIGVEVDFKKNFTAGLDFTSLKGNNSTGNLITTSLSYKF